MDRTMKRPIFFALVAASLWATAGSAQILVRAGPNMGLNVSMKFADSQSAVDFVVIQPTGDKSTATAQPINGGERAGAVFYPFDFTNAGKHIGTYTWTASVQGKEIAKGTFEYRKVENGELLFSGY